LGLGFASCRSSHDPSCRSETPPPRRAETDIDPGWPKADNAFRQVSYPAVHGTIPTLKGAEMVNDDEICMQCHEAYVKAFHENVHRVLHCEDCHGPASRHLETQGREPGLIFSFKKGVDPVARAEACLKCHEQNQCSPGSQWRTSKHAQCGVTCVDCHRGHYNVPVGTPATTVPGVTSFEPRARSQPFQPDAQARPVYQPDGQARVPYQGDPQARATLVSYNAADKVKENLPSLRGTSHNLGAMAPDLCLKCHTDMRDLLRVAGPHQIGGPNGFNCTTCHDPHGQIIEATRKDLCLSCHKTSSPTMAWHASTHERYGVSCTDCHNPHPHSKVLQVVNIDHYGVEQPKRLAMSVQEPEACYKCHQKKFAQNHLPSHHPIMEGKMVCSDCHDPHGQLEKNLKAETINQLCYKCHAEKTGPFAYPHPPVDQNCAICHEVHGTVANNLLRQPPAFLCLRCHSGHHRPTGLGHPAVNGVADIDANPQLRQVFYNNCTNCHTQIHGSDVPSQATPNSAILFR
jgi:DmsE family decaheme c-type cytochrome